MVNIFKTNRNARVAASDLPDFMVPRMLLESLEILCGAIWNIRYGNKPTPDNKTRLDPPWRRSLAQRRHPACLWAGASLANYNWLLTYSIHLEEQYTIRYARPCTMGNIISLTDMFAYLDWYYTELETTEKIKPCATTQPFICSETAISDNFSGLVNRYRALMVYKYMFLYKRTVRWTNVAVPSWVTSGKYVDTLTNIFGTPLRSLG